MFQIASPKQPIRPARACDEAGSDVKARMDRIFSSDPFKKGQLNQWYATLEALGLFNPLPEASFDKWTAIASQLLETPVSLFSVIDERRQFFKSQVGLEEPWATTRETPLSHSFCQIVRDSGEPLVITDARGDDRVAGNGAIEDLGVIAYLGAPVTMPDGQPIAALCAIDNQPRQWSQHQLDIIAALAHGVSVEVSLRVELARRRTAQQQLERVLEHLNMFTALVAADGSVMWTNSADVVPDVPVEDNLLDLNLWRGDEAAREQIAKAFEDACQGGSCRMELEIGGESGDVVYDVTLSAVRESDSHAGLILLTAFDITERVRAEERRQLLTREMAHRLRNLISVITTVASQTISKAEDLKSAEMKLRTRLMALARSHDVLLSNDWHGADLKQLFADELRLFESRYTMQGPSLLLQPQEAQTFALIAHELATNASKYGALKSDSGHVHISWKTGADGTTEFTWREEGGPTVEQPASTGFGSTILSQVAKAQFEGTADIEYAESGLCYRLVWPS
jgi:two-component sensor histidine kinase